MTEEKLIRMSTQIANFFETQSDDKAASGVAEHINKFWEKRMRAAFFVEFDQNPQAFHPLVQKAAATIKRP